MPQEDAHQDKMAQPESHPPHGTDEDAEAFTPLKDTLPSGGYALRRAKLRQRQEAEARDGEDAGMIHPMHCLCGSIQPQPSTLPQGAWYAV